jgi:putative flippase GtrA
MKGMLATIWPILKRYVRFGIVGASGIVVDMAVLFILSDPKMLALNLSLGKALAAEVAVINNFIWNETWTFGDVSVSKKFGARLKRLVKFNLICLAGIGLSILLLNLQVRFLVMNVYLANLIAIVIASVWNFGMNLKFGWNGPNKLNNEGTFLSSNHPNHPKLMKWQKTRRQNVRCNCESPFGL